MHIIPRLCLIFTLFVFNACREPEAGFVFLENATNEKLQLIAKFDGAGTASKPLAFSLDPGQRDGWRFIPDKKEAKKVDSTFQSLLIKSEKCERQIDRSVLEKHIRKSGAWILRIDEKLFFC